jgi:WYL_2, Sm-like SH3 beta-barrel fold
MTNDEILKKLTTEVCEIVFEKKDGSHREMICTLMPDLLPYVSKENMNESVRQNDFIPVYDLEEQAWRSFKPSKLISFKSYEE